jgi:hypothetical protein
VETLSEADDAAELSASAGMALAQNSTANEARHFLKLLIDDSMLSS